MSNIKNDMPAGGGGIPSDTVVTETTHGQASAPGVASTFSRGDHTHGSPTDPVPAHVAAADPHTVYQKESEKDAANGYAGLDSFSKIAVSALPATVVQTDRTNTFGEFRQTFQHSSNAGFRLLPSSGDPAVPVDGDLWFDLDVGKFRKRQGGITSDLDTVGGGGIDPPEGSYAPGSYTIATGKFRNAVKRQQFTTTQRLIIQGTARLSLQN